MLMVAAYCASRLMLARRRHRRTTYSVDATHAAMGIAMAAMLTSHITSPTGWVVLFSATAAWFAVRAAASVRDIGARTATAPSHLRHVLTSLAMVYMLVAAPTAASAATPAAATMTAATTGQVHGPVLALLLGVVMVGYAVLVMDRMSGRAPVADPTSGASLTAVTPVLAPRFLACCQVAMNLTMGYMLVMML